MTPPEPTAEARAAAWKLHEAWHHHFYGQYTIEACPACLEIALTLDAFRAQGVEQAERNRRDDIAERDLYRERCRSKEAELARVREESKGKHLVPCPICARAESEAKP